MQDILGQVGNLGFPIVVSLYLLTRVETKIDALTLSIHQLTNVIKES